MVAKYDLQYQFQAKITHMIRHFTSTGIVVAGNSTLVHWHRKVQAWLAPGGHVEPNEDPVQAVHREVKEETGLDVKLIPTSNLPSISNLDQVEPPYTVMIEDVFDEKVGKHQHIDFIYFATPVNHEPKSATLPSVPEGWHWVDRDSLANEEPLKSPNGELVAPPEDVIKLGLIALDLLAAQSGSLSV